MNTFNEKIPYVEQWWTNSKKQMGKTFKIKFFNPIFGQKIKILEKQVKVKNRRGKCAFCLHALKRINVTKF